MVELLVEARKVFGEWRYYPDESWAKAHRLLTFGKTVTHKHAEGYKLLGIELKVVDEQAPPLL